MFFELYWHYFVVGLILYIFARVGYVVYSGMQNKKALGLQKKYDEVRIQDQIAGTDTDTSNEEEEEDQLNQLYRST
ncbi:hypothetical protein JTB14_024450 [Gonioctena quinquepunctata]|nr:hypothetical protein JTB14_024450 [Gonioctena quinquepunctata]